MAPDKIDMVLDQIRQLRAELAEFRREQREENQTLHGRITAIDVRGCSLAPQHAALADHVARHEKQLNQAAGAIFAAGGIGGAISWVLSLLGVQK